MSVGRAWAVRDLGARTAAARAVRRSARNSDDGQGDPQPVGRPRDVPGLLFSLTRTGVGRVAQLATRLAPVGNASHRPATFRHHGA